MEKFISEYESFLIIMGKRQEKIIKEILDSADIKVNGSRQWDIQVNNDNLFARILAKGTLGVGESYMDSWWDCGSLDQLLSKAFETNIDQKLGLGKKLEVIFFILASKLLNMQRKAKAFEIGEKHYDVGNELMSKMLGKTMAYSCGYWEGLEHNPKNLDKAQEQKIDLICRKLKLEPGMKVLDIGCGWGSFLEYSARKYGVEITGVTVSKEQAKYAAERCKGLPVRVLLKDYRTLNEKFDRVLSIGMFEHVGPKNYRKYMEITDKYLKKDGLAFLHTIGGNKSVKVINPWIHKYIFPNAVIPSAKQITNAAEGIFLIEDWHNFGEDYDKTLMIWYHNFNKAWPELKKLKGRDGKYLYDERFRRMWDFYLLSCAATFRVRKNNLWQIVFSREKEYSSYYRIR